MAIKHEDVVVKGDLLTSTMWNKVHVIEDMTIKGIHIDSLQIGTDHLINDCVTTAKLAIQDYLDLVNRLTDPVLAKGRLWFREDLTKLRFSPDGVAVEELAWVGDLNSHATATPIDHPDLSVTSAKLADSAVGTTKLANLAVTSTKLADSSVTSTKLADLAVTPVKLSFGTWEKVVETEVTGTAVTEITVTGLDLDAAKAYYIIFQTGNPTATANRISVFYNDDTIAGNYFNQYIWASGTGLSASRLNNAEICIADAGQYAMFEGLLTRDSGASPRLIVRVSETYPDAVRLLMRTQMWTVEVNVTSITISGNQAGGIGVGSRLMIFKVSA